MDCFKAGACISLFPSFLSFLVFFVLPFYHQTVLPLTLRVREWIFALLFIRLWALSSSTNRARYLSKKFLYKKKIVSYMCVIYIFLSKVSFFQIKRFHTSTYSKYPKKIWSEFMFIFWNFLLLCIFNNKFKVWLCIVFPSFIVFSVTCECIVGKDKKDKTANSHMSRKCKARYQCVVVCLW